MTDPKTRLTKFIKGFATSLAAQVAALAAVATASFLWQFAGHVAADAGVHVINFVVGH